ncbi:E3 ubiquitin-protein ligase NEURL1-like isoform X1 [Amphibalanus amphitrite]|uniref:E3 ubiquitin-protein ligase NEURL1-like isoform X1 n=2 Tax=Amphibalanus amphitrite TaxID=1232801 RepID=UPI001C901697|nr:E3 ubiquitin-protein ligase NEURL1-like isoform X1 [Amphibalanus amphitrite]XP_043217343.1 E3 ubiquitin-protein ligase NEURL1-like isoform X1 [Amphibalanus amphitrite]XP_043217344.1 E3 ubiquitin-protein ligase NEURL1-like isoform X1 [Amphibalanus amphitrite]
MEFELPPSGMPVRSDPPPVPLRFHRVHGVNIRLSTDRRCASRVPANACAGGLLFSSRPLAVKEQIVFRISMMGPITSVAGVICVGFTTVDPASFERSPVSRLISDLVLTPGYWGTALEPCLQEVNRRLGFYATSRGSARLEVDGVFHNLIFSGVDTSRPFWAVIDIIGPAFGVQLIPDWEPTLPEDSPPARRVSVRREPAVHWTGSATPEDVLDSWVRQERTRLLEVRRTDQDDDVYLAEGVRDGEDTVEVGTDAGEEAETDRVEIGEDAVKTVGLKPCPLNRDVVGGPVKVRARGTEAWLKDGTAGYAFTAFPLLRGTWIRLRILETDRAGPGESIAGLSIGLTLTDPDHRMGLQLPADPRQFGDGTQLLPIADDVLRRPRVGDLVDILLAVDGAMLVTSRGEPYDTVLGAATALPVWLMLGLTGTVRAVRILGTTRVGESEFPAEEHPADQPWWPDPRLVSGEDAHGSVTPRWDGRSVSPQCRHEPDEPDPIPRWVCSTEGCPGLFRPPPGSDDESTMCFLCRREAPADVGLVCGHGHLCRACAAQWLLAGRPRECPICEHHRRRFDELNAQ